MYEDGGAIDRFRSRRRLRHGIFFGISRFLRWGLIGAPRGFSLLLHEWRERRVPPAPPLPPPADKLDGTELRIPLQQAAR